MAISVAEDPGGLLGDEEFLVGGHHRGQRGPEHADPTVRTLAVPGVGAGVNFEAERGQPLEHLRPDPGRVFSDSAGKEERVQAAEGDDLARDILGEPIAEDLQGEGGLDVAPGLGGFEFAHIARDPRESEEPALAIQ